MRSLPLFHRIAGTRVVVLGEGDAADAKRRLVERAGGTCCGEAEAHHARLAFVAIDDAGEAEAAVRRLKARGLLVNATDRPDLCDFTVPSVLDRNPVLVAVGTGGASAGLAKHLRLRLEAVLPPPLGQLAEALYAARDVLRSRFPDAADRRRALDAALAEGGALDPLRGVAADRVASWLQDASDEKPVAPIEIDLASDDPDDLTLREARWLGQADTVLHDSRVPPAILDRARADAVRRPLDTDAQPPAELPATGLTLVLRRRADS
ncbi:siroheme synthase [Pelagerythrobacter marensis]|uniref:precorrin-2 dehydrogenase n=1 Tax=Pelagerythrobacter marensis TaxID=543877 RepID=A0ABZ2D599_9SPHN